MPPPQRWRGAMGIGGWMDGTVIPPPSGLATVLAVVAALSCGPAAAAAGPEPPKLGVVLCPSESDGAPGVVLADRAIRSALAGEAPGPVELRNEYVDSSRSRDAGFMYTQVSLLRQKYAGRKVDLVI